MQKFAQTITIDNDNYGTVKCIATDRVIGRCILDGKEWENYNTDIFVRYCNKDSISIDLGAYCGYHTIKMSRLSKAVYSVECMPEHYKILLDNIRINELNNVISLNCAVGGTNKIVNIPVVDYSRLSNFGGTTLNTLMIRPKDKELTECRTLDSISKLFENEKVSFIKIDVEGMESEVLSGAMDMITKHKPVILVEIWKDKKNMFIVSELYDRFKTLGYSMIHHHGDDYLLIT